MPPRPLWLFSSGLRHLQSQWDRAVRSWLHPAPRGSGKAWGTGTRGGMSPGDKTSPGTSKLPSQSHRDWHSPSCPPPPPPGLRWKSAPGCEDGPGPLSPVPSPGLASSAVSCMSATPHPSPCPLPAQLRVAGPSGTRRHSGAQPVRRWRSRWDWEARGTCGSWSGTEPSSSPCHHRCRSANPPRRPTWVKDTVKGTPLTGHVPAWTRCQEPSVWGKHGLENKPHLNTHTGRTRKRGPLGSGAEAAEGMARLAAPCSHRVPPQHLGAGGGGGCQPPGPSFIS